MKLTCSFRRSVCWKRYRLEKVRVAAYDPMSKAAIGVKLPEGASRRIYKQGRRVYNVGRVHESVYHPSYLTAGFSHVDHVYLTCSDFDGDRCSQCRGNRGWSKCKRGLDGYVLARGPSRVMSGSA